MIAQGCSVVTHGLRLRPTCVARTSSFEHVTPSTCPTLRKATRIHSAISLTPSSKTIIEEYFIVIDVYPFWSAWRVSSLRMTGVSDLSRLAGYVQMRALAPRNYITVGLQVPLRSSSQAAINKIICNGRRPVMANLCWASRFPAWSDGFPTVDQKLLSTHLIFNSSETVPLAPLDSTTCVRCLAWYLGRRLARLAGLLLIPKVVVILTWFWYLIIQDNTFTGVCVTSTVALILTNRLGDLYV